MGNYRELVVWRRSHQLALQIYHATGAFPSGERYGLTGQLRRGSVSVTSNIVEGSARQTDPEQIRFLRIAHGALCGCSVSCSSHVTWSSSSPVHGKSWTRSAKVWA